jgi:hypothetical protein
VRIISFIAACALTAPLSFGADREFNEIVRSFSQEFHTRPTRIPFVFGLVNAFLFTAQPAGTKHMDVAIFEDFNAARAAGRDVERIISDATAPRWTPFVKVRSRHNGSGEQTFVYMRPEGKGCRLLVASIEPNEATVVQLNLNPEAVQKWLKEPRKSSWMRGGNE